MKTFIVTFLVVIINVNSFGQNSFLNSLRLDANINIANKKRSYAVYSGDKYANSGYFLGVDFGFFYETKLFNYGIEYFPYRHINASFEYSGLKLKRNLGYKLIPDLKFGYSPLLEKVYYGFGFTAHIKWFTFEYNKLLHIKSGNSRYHGDGLDCFSIGVKLKIPWEKEIPFRTTNERGLLN